MHTIAVFPDLIACPMEGGIGPCLSAKYTHQTFNRCPAWHTEHNHCAALPPCQFWPCRHLTGYFEPANLLRRRILVP